MSFDPQQFRDLISEVLYRLDLHSDDAVELLLGTAAQESHLGHYIRQIKGPARGAFQMEPDTENDIWINYLYFRPGLANQIQEVTGVKGQNELHLQGNLIYQIVMARIHYKRVPAPLPSRKDPLAMANYWDKYYNCNPDKGHPNEFVENYRRFVDDTPWLDQQEPR